MDDKDITETDEEFIHACKQATRHLTDINNRLHEDDELTGLESMSFMLALMSVECLGDTLDDSEQKSSNPYRHDDDETFY